MEIKLTGVEALKYAQAIGQGYDTIPAVVAETLTSVLEDWDLSAYERNEINKFLEARVALPF